MPISDSGLAWNLKTCTSPSPRCCWSRISPWGPLWCCLVCLWSVFPTTIWVPWSSGFFCFAHCRILSAYNCTWSITSPQHIFIERLRKENAGKSISSRFCRLTVTVENTLVPSRSSQCFPPRDSRERSQDRNPEEGGVLLMQRGHLQSFWPRELLEPLLVICEFHKNVFQAAEKHLRTLIKPSAMGNGTFMHTDFRFSPFLFFLSTAGKEASPKWGFQLSSLTRNFSFSVPFFWLMNMVYE